MKKTGRFITLEGTDGVGKTTQARLLKNWLKKRKKSVILTREPGGGPIAEKIRAMLLHPKTKIEDLTELFLYQAARIEHVQKIIQPALRAGKVVICDRFTDATIAYQGYARKLPLSIIDRLNTIATGGLKPHLTLLLELPPEQGLRKARRKKPLKKGGDRLENEGVSFQRKVNRGYQALAKRDSKRIKRVSVEDTISSTQEKIRDLVGKLIR